MSNTLERTEAQREAARINGAKSRGPITEEGKAISSQNARKHGLAARKFVLEDEDQADYDALLAGYRQSFSPADRAEDDLVRMLALYQFRLERAISVAVASTNLETLKQDAVVSEAFEHHTRDLVLAHAINERHRNGDGEACYRYENHFSRLYNRTLKNLRALQKDRLAQERAGRQAPPPTPPEAEPLCSINDLIDSGDIPSLRPGAELTAWERRRSPLPIRPQNEPEPAAVTQAPTASTAPIQAEKDAA